MIMWKGSFESVDSAEWHAEHSFVEQTAPTIVKDKSPEYPPVSLCPLPAC